MRDPEERLSRRAALRGEIERFVETGVKPEHRKLKTLAHKYARAMDRSLPKVVKAFDTAADAYDRAQKEDLALAVLEEKREFLSGVAHGKDDQLTLWPVGAEVRGKIRMKRKNADHSMKGVVIESTPDRFVVEVTETWKALDGRTVSPRYRWIFERRKHDIVEGSCELALVDMRIMKKGRPQKQSHRRAFVGSVVLKGREIDGHTGYSWTDKKGNLNGPGKPLPRFMLSVAK